MIHQLSRATTYIQTYIIHPETGQQIQLSYATGFFIRASQTLLLVTNWHVVTGLDPAAPSVMGSNRTPPHLLKVTVVSNSGGLIELTLPLYNAAMEPLWEEHPAGGDVDIVIYRLPITLENHFEFVDIHSAEDDTHINEAVAKDVFILGYPFSREDMIETFGDDAPYFLPVWKRGSIATEPALRLGGRVLLIDSLSRAGMSGAPVLIAQDEKRIGAGNNANNDLFKQMLGGNIGALDAFAGLDTQALTNETEKCFKFLGVYSGTIGSTRLAEVALGKCWHVETLRELTASARNGEMPFHAPIPNAHYEAFFSQFVAGELIRKNVDGEVIDRVSI
ncbi:Serine protease [Pseudomonas sp. IT-P100]|uniref:S1 family peptidase n=1 Tax=Pseudomonas sp. IT-P100 TaxID=3026452 RepID=UPI0039E0E80D